MDTTVVPIRGQTVLVRNEAGGVTYGVSGTDTPNESCYVMQRALGGGTVLGGTSQVGNWESQPDLNIANRIMQRAVDLCPALTGGKGVEGLSVIRHAVGLRPFREGGVRIERENIEGRPVVHNYGHAGWGYQGSYACSEAVVGLVDEVVKDKAKL